MACGPGDIREVWATNLVHEFKRLENCVQIDGRYLAAMDTEFAPRDDAVLPSHEPIGVDAFYHATRVTVDGGNLVQVGVDYAFRVAGGHAFQFNLRFDSSTRDPDSKYVSFLRDKAKLRHTTRILRRAPQANKAVTWLTFQGSSDFAYLVKALDGINAIPDSRIDFLNRFKTYFPSSYDVRVFSNLGRCLPAPIPGGLAKVAANLQVERLGDQHQAASDALLTLGCLKAMTLNNPHFAEDINADCGLLYGLVYASSDTITVIQVYRENFIEEAKLICGLFPTHCSVALDYLAALEAHEELAKLPQLVTG